MNWLTDRSRRYAFGVPFKNGYTSVKKVLNGPQGAIRIPHNRMKNFSNRVFIVRHPLDRFLSLWRNKARDHGKGVAVEGFTMQQLFDRIKTGTPDEHWIRQVDLLGKFRKGTELVRLENLAAWWWDNMQAEFPHLNKTDNYDEIAPDLRDQVLEHYAEDVKLYDVAE
jgi:hypothetical protein